MALKVKSEAPDDGDIKRQKTEASICDELSQKITKQLDYYFSDVNVVQDKFLLEEFKKNDGWVKINVLLRFKRLKELSEDESRVLQALKECEPEIVELDETNKQVRRKNPIPDIEEFKKSLELRTVHISGFPTDYNFDSLRRFCVQFGDVESVNMRRHFKTRFFKGCIHVVYKKEEDAKKVLDTEVLKCKDRELRKESMDQYKKRKAEMAQKRMEERKKKGKGKKEDTKSKDKTETQEPKEKPSEPKEENQEEENQEETSS